MFFLSIWRFPTRGNNVGIIVLKFGGFQLCFNGVQGSLTLRLGILGVPNFLKSELELVFPLCLHHLTNVFTKPVHFMTKTKNKNKRINIIHIVPTHGNILS
jgi:hypothetical protein